MVLYYKLHQVSKFETMQSWLDLSAEEERECKVHNIPSCIAGDFGRFREIRSLSSLPKQNGTCSHQKSWLTMKLSIQLTPVWLPGCYLSMLHKPYTGQHWLGQKLTLVIHNYTCCWNANLYFFQWLLSWLLHKWREGYLLPTWARKITCRCFDWMLQSSSGGWWWLCMFTIQAVISAVMQSSHQLSRFGFLCYWSLQCKGNSSAHARTHRAVLLRAV